MVARGGRSTLGDAPTGNCPRCKCGRGRSPRRSSTPTPAERTSRLCTRSRSRRPGSPRRRTGSPSPRCSGTPAASRSRPCCTPRRTRSRRAKRSGESRPLLSWASPCALSAAAPSGAASVAPSTEPSAGALGPASPLGCAEPLPHAKHEAKSHTTHTLVRASSPGASRARGSRRSGLPRGRGFGGLLRGRPRRDPVDGRIQVEPQVARGRERGGGRRARLRQRDGRTGGGFERGGDGVDDRSERGEEVAPARRRGTRPAAQGKVEARRGRVARASCPRRRRRHARARHREGRGGQRGGGAGRRKETTGPLLSVPRSAETSRRLRPSLPA